MIDLEDYPDGTAEVLVGIANTTEGRQVRRHTSGRAPRSFFASRRQVADWLGEDKEWVRYRLDMLVEKGDLDTRYWDKENARGPPTRVYGPNQETWKWLAAEKEIDHIFEERPTKIREYHAREILWEVQRLRAEVEELREEVEGQ
ncbi:hypothetical protein [Halobaculum magnesiiphilum]|uniref:Uncharacterized protein n=1 Tax=Halobaculum magnesiiphilum TaxID=1017351 RepID=A0A8T8WHQ6_9EURY|nr:hypothetical protein [Halobaculum magnesiiphilum]QZP39391.1 hypothetical protein K6T50_15915 [Halobaculum magnesiiphilum]